MPSNTSKLQISELDFDTLKLSLQNYLSGQSEWTDYKFDGSGLSVLLNLLSYNSHYLSYYLNMVANEMFLDSADKRESVVSIAAQLGYTPRSRVAAHASLNLVITPTGNPPANLTIDKNTTFNASVDNAIYKFNTTSATTVNYDAGNHRYVANGVDVVEGFPFTYKWTVDTSQPQSYVIPNSGVDINTIVVRVLQNSGSPSFTAYTPATDVEEIDPTSTVYYLREVDGGLYQIYFGDGILGVALQDGNIVYVDYINCSADAPNFANTFTAAQPIGGYSNIVVTTANAAFGGAEREDIDSVRFTAPKNYQAQNRAVTVDDYRTLIARDYPNVDSVAVWGGENNMPPKYGKVFLSLKPVSGYVITENTKQTIVSQILGRRNIVSIIPEIIDPEFLFLIVNSLVKYDSQLTSNTADTIKSLVLTTVSNFGINQIGKFERIFRYTVLTRLIDSTEGSITNNLTTVQMQKRFSPRVNISDQYSLIFSNAIVPGTLASTAFVDTLDPSFVDGDTYFFDDDSKGSIRTFKIVGATKKYTKTNSGTIDYVTGTITLTSFRPASVVDASGILKMTVTPVVNDVVPVLNNILIIDPADTVVNMVANSPVLI